MATGSTVIGIEISETRHFGGLKILFELMRRSRMRRSEIAAVETVELVNGNMLNPEFSGRLSRLTKLIVNNKVRVPWGCSGWPAPKIF